MAGVCMRVSTRVSTNTRRDTYSPRLSSFQSQNSSIQSSVPGFPIPALGSSLATALLSPFLPWQWPSPEPCLTAQGETEDGFPGNTPPPSQPGSHQVLPTQTFQIRKALEKQEREGNATEPEGLQLGAAGSTVILLLVTSTGCSWCKRKNPTPPKTYRLGNGHPSSRTKKAMISTLRSSLE